MIGGAALSFTPSTPAELLAHRGRMSWNCMSVFRRSVIAVNQTQIIDLIIREAEEADLRGLLELYTQLHGNVMPEFDEKLGALWHKILSNEDHHIILGLLGGEIISSCVLIVARNLTRGQRPYAFIENVITHEAHRNRGFATRLLDFARDLAKREGCY